MAKSKFVEVKTIQGEVYQYNSVSEAIDKSPFALWYILRKRECKKYENQINKVKRVKVNDIVVYES